MPGNFQAVAIDVPAARSPLTRRIKSNITGQVSWLLVTNAAHLAFPSG